MADTGILLWGLEQPGVLPTGCIAENDLWFGARRDNPAVHVDMLRLYDGDLAEVLPWLEGATLPAVADYDRFLARLDVYMGMLGRTETGRNASYTERRNHLFLLFRAFHGMLARRRFRYAFFVAPPHFGADAVLADLCARHGIPVYYGFQSLTPDRYFVIDHGMQLVAPPAASPVPPMPAVQTEQLFYMLKIKTPRRGWLDVLGVWLRLLLAGRVKGGAYHAFRRMFMQLQFQNDIAKATSLHGDIATIEHELTRTKYVYFPLHLQPEMTTSFLGGPRYHDQATVIEDLLRSLPADWQVLLKENPKQDWQQRHPAFFRRLLADPRVRFADRAVPSKLLTQHAQLVAAISGTVGWEALRMGKRVVLFGNCWYASLAGVHRHEPGLDLPALAARPLPLADVEEGFRRVMAAAWPGIIDRGYLAISKDAGDRDPQRVADMLACLPRAASPVSFIG